MQTDPDSYYARRAAHERAIADASNDTAVKAIHLELAERYERRIGDDTPTANRVPPAASIKPANQHSA